MAATKVSTLNQTIRDNGRLKEISTITDEKGEIIQRIISPLMVEFHFSDFLQVVSGSVLLAIPMSFSEELWIISTELGFTQTCLIVLMSLAFNSGFTYQNFYKHRIKHHLGEFIKRVCVTYLVSLAVAATFLLMINRIAFDLELAVSVTRVILVALPASLSATIADSIK